jgi:NADPH-dependent glutamate synthase beta subunit-like oxidoreductase
LRCRSKAGRPRLVQEEGEGRRLAVGVEVEDGVEPATLLLKVVGFGGEPEPGLNDEDAESREGVDTDSG